MKLILEERVNLLLNQAAEYRPNLEVGGFGHTRVDGDDIIVDDIFIPNQIVQGAHTDISVDGLDQLMMHAASRNETVDQWHLWWHSHSTMGTFASGQDESTLKQQALWFDSWAVGLVINVKHERHCWVVIEKPFRLKIEKVEVNVRVPADKTYDPQIIEWMEGVTTRAANPQSRPGMTGGGSSHGGPIHPSHAGSSYYRSDDPVDKRFVNDPNYIYRDKMWIPRYNLPKHDPGYKPYTYPRYGGQGTATNPPTGAGSPSSSSPLSVPSPSYQQKQMMKGATDATDDPEVQRIRASMLSSPINFDVKPSGSPGSGTSKKGKGKSKARTQNIGQARNVQLEMEEFLESLPEGPGIFLDNGTWLPLSQIDGYNDFSDDELKRALMLIAPPKNPEVAAAEASLAGIPGYDPNVPLDDDWRHNV